MKLQNIFALIVTLIGFAACTSESELLDTPVENSDLVPVTISLGSIQTKASVDLDAQEGNIENAVIGIFDSKGIPTTAPIVLKNGTNTGTTRLPLVKFYSDRKWKYCDRCAPVDSTFGCIGQCDCNRKWRR